MIKKFGMIPLTMVAIILTFMMVSCAKKDIQAGQTSYEEESSLDNEANAGNDQVGDVGGDGALDESELNAQKQAQEAEAVKEEFLNENIYFGFDSATLDGEAQELLRKKARWLEQNPETTIIIEGHCDNRGTEAYNLALGERRAESAKEFLADLGIDTTKIMTISYGEERPLDPGETEDAWARNRRASFVIQ